MQAISPTALRDLLKERGITVQAAGVLAGVNASTVSRVGSGEIQARPETIVKLAKALGISARRMKAMTDAAWAATHEGQDEAEWLPVA